MFFLLFPLKVGLKYIQNYSDAEAWAWECSYFFSKSEADVLINSVLRQNTACTEHKLFQWV